MQSHIEKSILKIQQMKKIIFILIGVLTFTKMFSQEFEFEYNGQTLSYTVVNSNYRNCRVSSNQSVTGDVVIPLAVIYNEIQYTVTSIDVGAFYDCKGLTSVEIPNSVVSIGDYAFAHCESLKTIRLPDSVTTIPDYAFSFCKSLESLDFPADVDTIGSYAFEGCESLSTMDIPDSVNTIGEGAFSYCRGLTAVELPNSLREISCSAFAYCCGLKSIIIPPSVVGIHSNAFSGCSCLTSVRIPNSVTYIKFYAFWDCHSLTSVDIPSSVASIMSNSFGGDNFTSINVDKDNPYYCSVDGVLFNKDKSSLLLYPSGRKGSYTIPGSTVKIGSGAFSDCRGLTSIILPNSVTVIDGYAFENCNALTDIEIPNSVTVIAGSAFGGSCGLMSVDIPASVAEIGLFAFSCGKLLSINVDEENDYYASVDGVLLSKDKTKLIQYPRGRNQDYSIPLCVTAIGESAFCGCRDMTSIELTNSILYIGSAAFQECSGLTSIEIPNSVIEIGSSAFRECSGLISIEIPNSVTSVGEFAFEYCTGLTTVELSKSVDYIGWYAFEDCLSLTSVYYNTDNPIEGSESIFGNCPEWATLYVPEVAVDICRQRNPWSQFKNIEAYDFSKVDFEIVDIDSDLPVDVYRFNGIRIGDSLEGLSPGLYIVRQGNNVQKLTIR